MRANTLHPIASPCVSAKSSIPWRSWYVLIWVTDNGTYKAQFETVGKHNYFRVTCTMHKFYI